MEDNYEKLVGIAEEIKEFVAEFSKYIFKTLHINFNRFEKGKGVLVQALYKKRGKHSRKLVHSGMAALAALGMTVAPIIAEEFPGQSVDPWSIPSSNTVLSAATSGATDTLVSDKVRDKVIEYEIQSGDTVATIATKFGISEESIIWQNDLSEKNPIIKTGETLEILPVTGVSHIVKKGDTVHSIAKRYDSSAQAVADFPFNTFTNDETFELAVGQSIIVPGGVPPKSTVAPRARRLTPNAGTVVASGQFVWPTSGSISQGFAWYHKALDIANRSAPSILAADSGTVTTAGWSGYGYGNHVIVDHGNGYRTLYAHMSSISVVPGQTVVRGNTLGRMGSTGRSTGTHLHFEVIRNGVYLNPLSVLK